jgi:hypothetical protein
MPLHNDARFHSIAFPQSTPVVDSPAEGGGPLSGTLFPPDAELLAGILRNWTSTPDSCWFCIWDGYGWVNVVRFSATGEDTHLPDPIPEEVRQGRRVRFPARDYLLYAGPVEAVTITLSISDFPCTPNLWWPEDQAWCVANEIYGEWTYVGGPQALIDRILSDGELEVLPAEPDDPLFRIEPWLEQRVNDAVDEVLDKGTAQLRALLGSIDVSLSRPQGRRAGSIVVQSSSTYGTWGTSTTPIRAFDEQWVRRTVAMGLTFGVLGLASR